MTALRVAVSGCGNRSRTVWQRLLRGVEGVALVGVQDPDPTSLTIAQTLGLIGAHECYADLAEMLHRTTPDALIVCSINDAHASAVEAGLSAGCHVLVEKPFAVELAEAVRLAAMAEGNRLVLGVVQNWRAKSVGRALRQAIERGTIGRVSHVFFRYLRDRELAHLPDYLFEEPNPLLFAMAIHHVDLFRFVLQEEIVRVEGHAFKPVWSRYRHPSGMHVWMETAGGVVISYVGTFSSRNGHLPLESLQVEGERGTLCNESAYSEPPLWLSRRGEPAMVDLTAEVAERDVAGQYALGDLAILRNFHAAVTHGEPLVAAARDNLRTLAVLEAARLSCCRGGAVSPQEVLANATSMMASEKGIGR